MEVSLLYYIKQFQFNQFIIMMNRSPNKQTVQMDVKTSIAFLLHQETSQLEHHNRNAQMRVIQLSKEQLKKELEIFSWRYKTYLPIVKPLQYLLKPNTHSPTKNQHLSSQHVPHENNNNSFRTGSSASPTRESIPNAYQNNVSELVVKMEEIKCRLSDIDLLPFSQIIYLIKEMMIGYDALLDIFGNFGPTQQMVAVGVNNQWKVWINEDFFRNQKYESNPTGGERQFIYRLLLIAEKHCQGSNVSKIFFHQMKQYTYTNECSFIKVLQKIKEFTKTNKIFQANKVILPNQNKPQKPFNPESPSFKASLNVSDNFGQANQRHKAGQYKLKLQKKMSYQPQPVGGICSPTYQGMKRSNFNNIPSTHNNMTHMTRQPTGYPNQLYHVQSQKVINRSSMFYYPQHNPIFNPQFAPTQLQSHKSSTFLQKPFQTKKPIRQSQLQTNEQKKISHIFKSPELFQKPQSPQPQLQQMQSHLGRDSASFANISKSRHELKLLVNKKDSKSPSPQAKARKNQRKYSEQIFKPRSVDALAAGIKKICGSNIYEQDPEIKMNGVNVIKTKAQANLNSSPSKLLKEDPSSNKTQQKTSTFKGPGSSTPNHSSSTNEIHRSDEHNGKSRVTSYQNLKQNDLNSNKLRNNQSSYYGMGNYPSEQKRENKNMTISYEFKNRNENQSKSSASSNKQQQENGNNWAKKISGLFSDDASIKHLKGSVKFKTAEEERFEKEYLKDVKLQMLEKFGRPVRHSIVDQEDDFRPTSKNPYKSMQLIEEVLDQGKSYMQKEESQRDEEEVFQVRGRTRTVQVFPVKQQSQHQSNRQIKQKQCVSYECSENSDSQAEQFNFQSEGYVINRR